eukprot:XP_011673933.1 PREDICTED: uncharacterized protein LOC105442950 [Strongylocentrotus purpuratus]
MTMLKQRFIGSISFLLLLAVDISFGGQDINCDAAPRDLTVQFRGASCASHRHGSCVGDRSFGHGQPLPIGLFDRSQSGGQAPVVVYENADPDSFYSVLMIDPDAPSPSKPTAAPWLHWLVVNINGETLRSGGRGVGGKTVTGRTSRGTDHTLTGCNQQKIANKPDQPYQTYHLQELDSQGLASQ